MASLVVPVAIFVLSLAALVWSSDRFVSAVEEVGFAVGISPFIIGATVVAAGTSLPELVSSVLAVLRGAPTIVVGNVVGSNVANVLFIIGIATAVGGHLRIDRELMRVDLPLLAASAVFLAVAVWVDPFRWYEGLLALVGVGTYVHFTLSVRTRLDEVVGELVAVTAVAVGTSWPEVAVSLAAVRRDEVDTAVGNVLGSNVFNTLSVGTATPGPRQNRVRYVDPSDTPADTSGPTYTNRRNVRLRSPRRGGIGP